MDHKTAVEEKWIRIIHEVGYIGKDHKIFENRDKKFGNGNWIIAHSYGESILNYCEALKLYEDSYFKYLNENQDVLEWLLFTANDVYDNSESNINSGLDYSIQENDSVHLQDISIRRVLKRMDRKFNGDHLVEIRGIASEGYRLNPGQVPFIEPNRIINSGKKSWWKEGSIEHFWQDNKILLVRPSSVLLKPIYKNDNRLYLRYNKNDYYFCDGKDFKTLFYVRGRDVRRFYQENRDNIEKLEDNYISGNEVEKYNISIV